MQIRLAIYLRKLQIHVFKVLSAPYSLMSLLKRSSIHILADDTVTITILLSTKKNYLKFEIL